MSYCIPVRVMYVGVVMSKRGVIVDAVQHLAGYIRTDPAYNQNSPETIKAWEILIDALSGEDGNDMEADGKVSASLTDTLLVFDDSCWTFEEYKCPYYHASSCDKYKQHLRFKRPLIIRCEQCEHDFPSGLRLEGVK